jgi:hypothetical protein
MLLGGARKMNWKKRVTLRKKELEKMKTSKSYISFDKLNNKEYIYITLDNGARPFIIIVSNNIIKVYLSYTNKLLFKISKFLGYWSGFDSSPYKIYNGNSILIQLTPNKYMHIGCEIFTFVTKDIITDFLSPVGNSDVPYPIAYGTENVYFMLDKKYYSNDDILLEKTVSNSEDIYGEFYEHLEFKKNRKLHKMAKLKIIQKRIL